MLSLNINLLKHKKKIQKLSITIVVESKNFCYKTPLEENKKPISRKLKNQLVFS